MVSVGWKGGASLSVLHNDSYRELTISHLLLQEVCGTYLIGIVNVQEGWQIGGKEYLEDLVCRRWLILCREISQRAAEQRHAR